MKKYRNSLFSPPRLQRAGLSLLLLALPAYLLAQASDSLIYKVNHWLSGSIAAIGTYTNFVGLPKVKQKDRLAFQEILHLTQTGVGRFNRAGLRQNPELRHRAHTVSDFLMYGTASLPFLLFADPKVKPAYLSVSLMYLETIALTSNLYTYSPLGPTFTDRYRPLAYYGMLSLEERSSGNQRNSFYSGHVATTAMGSFFLAKVLYDHHPEWSAKRYLLFAGAAVPAATMGWLRLRALKHFPSDLIAGGLIGAGMGLLIPELHRRWQQRAELRAGFGPQGNHLALNLRF